MASTLIALAMNPHLDAEALNRLTADHFARQERLLALATEQVQQLPTLQQRLDYARFVLQMLAVF